jgi:2-keto-4-pentenoate hydratase
MAVVDSRLVAATRKQLSARKRLLDDGATHVGWKLGMGERESIGGHVVVGYLSSATVLDPGASFAATGGEDLHVDVEAYVALSGDGPDAIGGYGVALEVVDLTRLDGEPDSVVATNIFHRAVSFAAATPDEPRGAWAGIRVNGELRQTGCWPEDLADRLSAAAEVLAAAGESLRAGDRIITGSVVQVPVTPGDSLAAVIRGDAVVSLEIA